MTQHQSHFFSLKNDHESDAFLMRLAEYEEKGEASPEEQPALDHLLNELESFVEVLQTPLNLEDKQFLSEDGCLRALEQSNRLHETLHLQSESTSPEQELTQVGVYQILSTISSGGMGRVYRAVHRRLGQEVALKTLPGRKMLHKPSIARFDREMKLVGKLNHPRIVKAYDAGEVEGIPYLAMELVEGIDLSTLVKRGGTLAIEDACEVIRQAAEGLQYIHKQGLVHRDIKPSNLMLTTHGEVKILDLGLAQIRMQGDDEELTRSGQVMGTLDYMAPEQALDSSKVDHRADIYSLGVTFYKLLTGATPFDRKNFGNPLQKTRAMLNEESPAVSVNRPDFPVELDLLVKRMLVRNPEDRCADLREIENLLAPFARAHTLSSLVDVSCREEDQTRIRQTAERGAKGLGWKIFTFALVILVIAGFWIESHWFPGNSVISPEENPERAQSENSSPEISKSNFKDSPISGMESRFTEMGLYWLVPDQADLPLKPLQVAGDR